MSWLFLFVVQQTFSFKGDKVIKITFTVQLVGQAGFADAEAALQLQ